VQGQHSGRHHLRFDLNPPEVGVLYLEEPCYITGTFVATRFRNLFVDLINRSPSGVMIRTEKRIEPATAFYLSAYDKADKTWEVFAGQTRWILQEREIDATYKVGAELKPAEADMWFLTEEDSRGKIQPLAADYQFFRKTDLLKSISRDAVCPLLNTITFQQVTAGQRVITQGDPGDACYVIQKGTSVVKVEKDGELIPVARLQSGDVVGEMALITGEPRSAHVDAETDMHLWCLGKSQFDKISRTYPELRSFLTDLVANWFETRLVTAKRRIGKYVITEIIGKGGYSIVYRGIHEALGKTVAVKMLKHDMATNSDFIRNFRKEAQTIAKFNHENIIKVYDIEERFQTLFIVMEHLEGMSLRTLLHRLVKLPPLQVVDYLLQICAGLQYAHAKNVVHQDIKPGNIFILPNEKIKILDFGLACPCGSENFLTGTPFYMSPEQIDCMPVDARADIFALGLTAYEMLTGQRPFKEENGWKVMDLLLKQDVPDPMDIVPDLPNGLGKFLMKACARNLSRRYQNVSEVVRDLHPLIKNNRRVQRAHYPEERKTASMFLLYRDEHQPALNRMMEDFCDSVNTLGVVCKTSEFNEFR